MRRWTPAREIARKYRDMSHPTPDIDPWTRVRKSLHQASFLFANHTGLGARVLQVSRRSQNRATAVHLSGCVLNDARRFSGTPDRVIRWPRLEPHKHRRVDGREGLQV